MNGRATFSDLSTVALAKAERAAAGSETHALPFFNMAYIGNLQNRRRR